MIKLIEKDVYLLNQNNYSQRIFEGEIPLSKGMSYNAYVILDDKTALLDSADSSVLNEFVDNNNIIARQVTYLSKLESVKGFYIFSYSSLKDNDETKNLYSAMQ